MRVWKLYRRINPTEMRPYEPGESILGVSLSHTDILHSSPKQGDMIARDPENHHDLWLISAASFAEHYEPSGKSTERAAAEAAANTYRGAGKKARL
jgi:hypothetical protein